MDFFYEIFVGTLNQNTNIFIYENEFENVTCKMVAILISVPQRHIGFPHLKYGMYTGDSKKKPSCLRNTLLKTNHMLVNRFMLWSRGARLLLYE